MRSTLFSKFGMVSPSLKPVVLRCLYRELTDDCSSPGSLSQAEIDERMMALIDAKDPEIVVDLRHLNSGRKSQYDEFWKVCGRYYAMCVCKESCSYRQSRTS